MVAANILYDAVLLCAVKRITIDREDKLGSGGIRSNFLHSNCLSRNVVTGLEKSFKKRRRAKSFIKDKYQNKPLKKLL